MKQPPKPRNATSNERANNGSCGNCRKLLAAITGSCFQFVVERKVLAAIAGGVT